MEDSTLKGFILREAGMLATSDDMEIFIQNAIKVLNNSEEEK